MCPNRPGRRRIPVADSTTFQGNLELALLSTPFPLSLLSVSLGRKFTHYLRSPSVGARGHSGTVARLRSPRSSTTTYTRLLCLSLSLPLTSLSLPSLFLSVPSRASLLLPLQIPRFGVSVPLLERFPLPLGRLPLLLLLLFPQYHILLAPHQRVRAGSLVTLPRLRRSALHP